MATKPTVGGSDGSWGTELNAHLDVSLDTDGKVDDGAAQTTSAAPGADAELANKLYVDNSQTLRCRMYLGSDQAVNSSPTETVIAFDTDTYDDDNISTTGAAAKITPAVAGYYYVSLGARVNSLAAGKLVLLRLYKNTTINNQYSAHSGVADNLSVSITDIVYLDADDYIQAKIIQSHGSTRNIDGTSLATWMTLQRVGG